MIDFIAKTSECLTRKWPCCQSEASPTCSKSLSFADKISKLSKEMLLVLMPEIFVGITVTLF
jgi:hypothetical protein